MRFGNVFCPSYVWRIKNNLVLLEAAAAVCLLCIAQSAFAQHLSNTSADNQPPVADAGLPRYASVNPVKLDGTGSYDPDNSGPLSYLWRQISGPSVIITDANTATPTISGFTQTGEIQNCEFELVVSDDSNDGLPDIAIVKIVPSFGLNSLMLENASFDLKKPTIIYFGGGDCVNGFAGQPWNGGSDWMSRANIIGFPNGYTPDTGGGGRTYYKYGDMIITYLSAVAPNYTQSIQTIGWSTGGDPAIDVGIRLNRVYMDARYAVNRVTHLDVPCRVMNEGWDRYLASVNLFLTSSVDGEQCWLDHYYGTSAYPYEPFPRSNILWVRSGLAHDKVRDWYRNSLTGNDMNKFNSGIIGGAYLSVIGPGKNLQLAPQTSVYYFNWTGNEQSGVMSFYLQAEYPGRLPEPVKLLDPVYVEDSRGYLLTCEESENAISYELLIGCDPYRVMDYEVISDTSAPPNDVLTPWFFELRWWTVRVRNKYGATIYADPKSIKPSLGILDLHKNGKMDFKDFAVLAQYWSQNESSLDFAPAPFGDGKVDIRDFAVMADHWLAYVGVCAHWRLDETAGNVAKDSAEDKNGTVYGNPLWQPTGGKIDGALQLDGVDDYVSTPFVLNPSSGPFTAVDWVKGGSPGQVVLSQQSSFLFPQGKDWLCADPAGGKLMTALTDGSPSTTPLVSEFVITDGEWHYIAVTWDGSRRRLYADGTEVAEDPSALANLVSCDKGLNLGAGRNRNSGSFWSGLIDDVRIYDRAITP